MFNGAAWVPILEKYGAVTQLSVALYAADKHVVHEPQPATPIVSAFHAHAYDPGILPNARRRVSRRPPTTGPRWSSCARQVWPRSAFH
jgi:hypothetical protein